MTKGKKLLDNAGAIADLEKQLEDYHKQQGQLSALILKAQGALDVLRQIEEGVEIDDTKSTD
jgi:hypothetical protein